MNILKYLRPAPFVSEVQNPEEVKKKYKYWRLRIFFSMYLGYALYYFTRKSFTFAIPGLSSLGFTKFELGLIGTVLSVSYGVSKFLSGIIGDRSNPRYFMSIGLIMTGIFNLLFGMSSSLIFMALFWGMNGLFQGWGWPACAKLLTHWYSHSERGRWWSLWNTSHNLGGSVIPLISALAVFYMGWRYALYIPGVTCIIVGFFLMKMLRDTPQSMGLPPIETYKNEPEFERKNNEKSSLSTKELLFDYVLKNPFIWLLAISYFFIYIIRTAVNDWSLLYLVEAKKYSHLIAGVCVSLFEIGGFFGSLAAGWISDKIFKGKRNPVNILFTIGVLCSIISMRYFSGVNAFIDANNIFWIGFFIFGPQMLIGIAAAELSHKNAAATATGFAGCFAYLGAAMAGGPLGAWTTAWGWNGYFNILTICCVIASLLLLPMWSAKTRKSKELSA